MLQIERLPKINVDSIRSHSSMSSSAGPRPLQGGPLQTELELGFGIGKSKKFFRFAIVSMRIVIIKFAVI